MLIGEDDISNEVIWYLTLQISQGLASCKKFLVLLYGTWAEFRISKLRIPVSTSNNFPDFPLIGAKVYYRFQCSCYCFPLNCICGFFFLRMGAFFRCAWSYMSARNKKIMYVVYSRAALHPNTAACMQGRPWDDTGKNRTYWTGSVALRLLKATEVEPLLPVNNWKMKMASKLRKNKTKQEKNKSLELCFLKKLVSYGQMLHRPF